MRLFLDELCPPCLAAGPNPLQDGSMEEADLLMGSGLETKIGRGAHV